MNTMIEHATIEEIEHLERAAYATGDTKTAELLSRIADLQSEVERLEAILDDLPSEKQRDQDASDLIELRQFFYDCFEHLDGHYPCPSFTSDYHKSVIFEAIQRGEATRED
jgi:molecular chaperone GrpE (heat shock protein)